MDRIEDCTRRDERSSAKLYNQENVQGTRVYRNDLRLFMILRVCRKNFRLSFLLIDAVSIDSIFYSAYNRGNTICMRRDTDDEYDNQSVVYITGRRV